MFNAFNYKRCAALALVLMAASTGQAAATSLWAGVRFDSSKTHRWDRSLSSFYIQLQPPALLPQDCTRFSYQPCASGNVIQPADI